MCVGIIQSIKSLNRTKRQRKGKSALSLSWAIHLLLPSDIGPVNYNTSLPDSATCKWQIMELLGLLNCMRQFL